ncbi:hypothetical protein R2360_16675 [Mycobacteroides chelonae]|uniref:Transmembrane protein n=1 Tax=Mycobacteroides chelonae TaxID=1774 RepID=A0AB73U588_MYCCH|nr:hypothetical protein [Mycobacteroides chelonae]MEC4841080.1 hypothetical protein [Mycobacteroides chelonae]MEC4842789.1 hypothetical protein [Mycobacteroides chelonae]OLT73221.1 hypothetical protein BKG57_22305 [Mycobacteroides chelonae]QDF71798.1 hypothetical protein FJK96_17650 [Mycobacteroides chelonae]WED92118.1 hypothetical protein PXJ67_00925 [Mycobacteroides chelonae]
MAHPDNPAWRRNTTLTPRRRFARGGIFYERVINVVAKITTGVLIAAGIGLASGVIPHAWCYAGDHANGFWILAAILFLLEAVCLLFTIGVFWFSPERQLIPKNQLTSRIKQYIKISVSVAVFGMSAFWGALAGEMVTDLHDKGFHIEDAHHLLSEVVGTPIRMLLSLAWMVVLAVAAGDLWANGRNGRARALSRLRHFIYGEPSEAERWL